MAKMAQRAKNVFLHFKPLLVMLLGFNLDRLMPVSRSVSLINAIASTQKLLLI